MSKPSTHEHAGEGPHQHGPGESHTHVWESFAAHGHFHEEDLDALEAADTTIDAISGSDLNPGWMVLNSVGIDIGSSTSHLTFSRLFLERRGMEMSSRFVTVRRDVLYRSPILLTEYLDPHTIHVEKLSSFVQESYVNAGIAPSEIHTGAVICTGEAVKKTNSEAITRLFSEMGGRFVCATAGPRLEAILAANGSGSVARSRDGKLVMNLDVGGGTTKVTVSSGGTILETGAINLGARLIAWDPISGLINRVEDAGAAIAEAVGFPAVLGHQMAIEERQRFAVKLVDLLLCYLRQESADELTAALLITGPFGFSGVVDEVVFSGGVSEYIYDHERGDYGDLGSQIATELKRRFAELPGPVVEGTESIRATVIGASQYTVQVSSSTIFLSDKDLLPVRDHQVVVPRFDGSEASEQDVARAISAAMARYDLLDEDTKHPVALYLDWPRPTSYANLSLLAGGIAEALETYNQGSAWVLICEKDIGGLLGAILKEDMGVQHAIVAVDEVEVTDLDFVDIGQVLGSQSAVPVVVKSLVFE